MSYVTIKGAKGGGGGSFKQTPDNLRSNDTFEGVLGLCIGPIKGPTRGLKSIKLDGTAIENETGQLNFTDFVATVGNGDPAQFPQVVQLKLGAGAAPTQVGTTLVNTNGVPVPATKTLVNTNAQFMDLRFIVNQLFRQDAKGIYDLTATLKIEMKPVGSTNWINPTIGTPSGSYSETGYQFEGLEGALLQMLVPASYYDGSGQPLPGPSNYAINGKTTGPAVYELRIALPTTGAYADTGWDVRVTLLERDKYTGGKDNADSEVRSIQWESIAAVYGSTMFEHEDTRGVAWLQLYGKASDQLTGVPEVFVEADTKIIQVPPSNIFNPETRQYNGATWDGSWAKAYTNDPAWVISDAISDGLSGISLIAPGSYLNKWDALEMSKWCSQLVPDGAGGTHPRYSLNIAIRETMKAEDFIRYLAGAVGGLAWDQGDGEWRVKMDKPEAPVDLFTLDNIEGEFVYSNTDVDTRYNDITMTFLNEEMDYREDSVHVYNNASIALIGRKPTKLVAVGCTNRQEALRRALMRLLSATGETRVVNFTTNRRGRNVEHLDTILIADGDLGDLDKRTNGRTIAIAPDRQTITLRDTVYLAPGVAYTLRYAVPNPDYAPSTMTQPTSVDWKKPTITQTRAITNAGSTTGQVRTLTLDQPLPEGVPDNLAVALEATNLVTLPKLYRATNVSFDDDGERVSISALEVKTDKWTLSDNVSKQDTVFQDLRGAVPMPLAPPDAKVLNLVRVPTEQGSNVTLTANWVRPAGAFISGFAVRYRINGGAWVSATERTQFVTLDLVNPAPGKYEVEITTLDRRGGVSLPLTGALEVTQSLIDATQIFYNTGGDNPPSVQDMMPAQPGADVTGENPALDTKNVGGRPVQVVLDDVDGAKAALTDPSSGNLYSIEDIVGDLDNLKDTYGDTANAAASADAAKQAADTATAASSNAQTARDQSQAARDAAQGAQSLAADAKTAAQTAASNAQSAQSLAESARTAAQTARDAAQDAQKQASDKAAASAQSASSASGFASTASGQATIATQKATDAGTSATNAKASENSASTSAGTATTKASEASTSATNALGSQNAAATSASVSASSASAASASAAATIPSTFENGSEFFRGDAGAAFPTTVALSTTDAGPTYTTNNVNSYAVITTRNAMLLVPGRYYRVSAKVKNGTASTDRRPWLRLAMYNSAGSRLNYTGNTFATGGTAWEMVSYGPTSTEALVAINANTVAIRPEIILNYGASGTTGVASSVSQLLIEDVTQQVLAASSATAAAGSASTASTQASAAGVSASAAKTSETNAATSAGNANTSAGQASQSATNAAGSSSSASNFATAAATSSAAANQTAVNQHPISFEQDGLFFDGDGGAPTPNGGLFATLSGTGRVYQQASASATAIIGWKTCVPFTQGKWKVRAKVGNYQGVASAATLRISSYNEQAGDNRLSVLSENAFATPADGFVFIEAIADLSARTGVSWIKPELILRYGPGAADTIIRAVSLELINVTSEQAAAASASAAATSASNANTSATNAGQSATTASTQATNASTSAGNANTYANNASTSATNAKTSETNAASSASTATTQAGVASTSANAALATVQATVPSTMSGQDSFWTLVDKSATNATSGWGTLNGEAVWTGNVNGGVNAYVVASSRGSLPVTVGRRYKVQAQLYFTNGGLARAGMIVGNLDGSSGAIDGAVVNVPSGSAYQLIESNTFTAASGHKSVAPRVVITSGSFVVRSILLIDVTAQELASGFADAAAGSASTASTKASDAGNSATSASGSANTASTKAGEAAGSATAAAGSASAADTSSTNAAQSASSAQSSSVSAKASFDSSQAVANRLMPDRPSVQGDYVSGNVSGSPETAPAWATDGNAPVVTDTTEGSVRQIAAVNYDLYQRGWMRIDTGKTFRFTIRGRTTAGTLTIVPRVTLLDASGANLGYPAVGNTFPLTTSWQEWSVELTSAALRGLPNGASATYFRVGFWNNGGAQVQQYSRIGVVDITSEKASAGSATAAAGSASSAAGSATAAGQSASAAKTSETNAGTSASNASTSAGQASTSATNAAGSASTASTQASNAAGSATNAGNSATAASGSASSAGTSATNAGNSATAAASSATSALSYRDAAANAATGNIVLKNTADDGTAGGWGMSSVADAGPSGLGRSRAFSMGGGNDAVEGGFRPGNYSARYYRCRGYVKTEANSGPGIGVNWQNASGGTGLTYNASFAYTAGAWTAFDVVVGPTPADAVAGRGFVRHEANKSTLWTDLTIEDITDSRAAAGSATAAANSATTASSKADAAAGSASSASGSANNASTSAGNASTSASAASGSAAAASSSASAASQSATLATSYSAASFNTNDKFANWPGAASTMPTAWQTYFSNGSYRWERVSGLGSAYGIKTLNDSTGAESGFYAPNVPVHNGAWVVEVTARLDANTWIGSGVTIHGIWNINFATDADSNGVVSFGLNATRTWSKLFVINGELTQANVHAMHGWKGFGNQIDPRYMTWFKLSLRPANAAEIAGNKALANSNANAASITSLATTVSDNNNAITQRATTLESRAMGSGNLFQNTEYLQSGGGINGWAFSNPNQRPTDNIGVNFPNSGWYPANERVLSLRQANRAGATGFWSGPGWVPNSVPVTAGQYFQFYVICAAQNAKVELALSWYNSNGGVVTTNYTGGTAVAGGGNNPTSYSQIGWASIKCPDGATQAQLNICKWDTNDGASDSWMWVWRVYGGQARQGQTEWNPFSHGSSRANQESLMSRVTTTEGTLATVSGRVEAFFTKEVVAGSATAFISARAKDDNGNLTSDVSIGAKRFSVYNDSGQNWIEAMRVSNGNALFSGGISASSFTLLANGQQWRFQMAAATFQRSNGEAVTTPDFGALPKIEFGPCPVALNSGEVYSPTAANLTNTGFTPSLIIQVPGAPSAQSVGSSGAASGSGPTYQKDTEGKPTSVDGSYTVNVRGTAGAYFRGGNYQADDDTYVQIFFDVYALKNGAWVKIAAGQGNAQIRMGGTGTSPGTRSVNWVDNTAYQMGAGVTAVGVTFTGYAGGNGSTVTGINGITWQSQANASSTRSATPNGEKITITVRPQ